MASDPDPFSSPLTGKGSNTSTPRQEAGAPDWTIVGEVQEFVPQGFDATHVVGRIAPSSLVGSKKHQSQLFLGVKDFLAT